MSGKLPLPCFASNLLDHVADLSHARRSYRMALGLEPAARVHGLGAVARGISCRRAEAALAAGHEAQVFERDDLGDREALVQPPQLHIATPDPAPLVRLR